MSFQMSFKCCIKLPQTFSATNKTFQTNVIFPKYFLLCQPKNIDSDLKIVGALKLFYTQKGFKTRI